MPSVTNSTDRRSSILASEDWWALFLGLALFLLSLGVFCDTDLLGFVSKTEV